MVQRWKLYLDSGVFSLAPIEQGEEFWVSPASYWELGETQNKMVTKMVMRTLKESDLVIFKVSGLDTRMRRPKPVRRC